MSEEMTPLRPENLEELGDFLRRYLPYDRDLLTEEVIREKIWGDDHYQPNFAWVIRQANQIVAFGFAVPGLDREIGHLKFLVVAQEWHKQGIGSYLLDALEDRLRSIGVKQLRVDERVPNYLNPGIDPRYTEGFCFLQKRGYELFGEAFHMKASLDQDFATEDKEGELAKQGIRVFQAQPEDWPRVREWLTQVFPNWVPEVERTFRNRPPSLHLAEKKDQVIAFSAYNVMNPGTGWFGPMGTDPGFQGRGIGSVLLKRCLRDLKAEGRDQAIIPWVGPLCFYFREVGATVSRIFWRMVKDL